MKKDFRGITVDTITKAKMDTFICESGKKMSYAALINWLIDTSELRSELRNDKKSIHSKNDSLD